MDRRPIFPIQRAFARHQPELDDETHQGDSELARSADDLPVRSRIGLALVAADLAIDRLKYSPNFHVAQVAFALARRWYDGERFDPDCFEEAVSGESPRGVSLSAIEARSQDERSAWLVLASAVLYTAFRAYRTSGECPSPVVSEVEENELDEVDKALRSLSSDLITTVLKAADDLKQHPDVSFAQLKAHVSRT